MKRLWLQGVAVGFAVVAAGSPAQAQGDFYRGKTVSIVVGTKSGSLVVAAQLVGRHMAKHIPGNPAVINQVVPGGAHLVATNYVFNVAEADGLTLLAVNPQVAIAQLAKVPAVRFDIRKFEWLGSSGADGVLMGIRADLPYTTFKDLQSASPELIVGATGPGSNSYDFPLLLKEFAGAKLRFVTGYATNTDILLALERKEVDAWTALATTVKQMAERGTVRLMVRGRTPISGVDHVPIDEDLTTDPVGKSLMAIRGIPLSVGRAYGVRPGTPADRIAILRGALAKTIADPQFLAEAKVAGIEMAYIPVADIMKSFDELMNQPAEVLDAMTKYIKVGD